MEENWKDTSEDWRDSPFLVVLYEYAVKNTGIPSDMGTLIAYLLLFLVTWYVVIWAARCILSLIWPVLLCISALFLFRILRSYDQEDLLDMLFQGIALVADTVVVILSKTLGFFLSFLH